MNSTEARQTACMNAMTELIDYLRRGTDARETTEALLRRYVSAGAILEAGERQLSSTALSASEAKLLALIPALTRSIERSSWGEHPLLNNVRDCTRYLHARFLGVPYERFYALSLDEDGTLIRSTLLAQGTLDETPFYLGGLLKCAVDTDARAMVLSHNHPGGTLQPSRADIACTAEAREALTMLGIPLIDHIIVADGRGVSFRQNGFLSVDASCRAAFNVRWLENR